MKSSAIALFLLICVSQSASPQLQKEEYGPLLGSYDVIGRKPDSTETYSGIVELSDGGSHIRIKRSINGRSVEGTGRIEYRTPDKIRVFTFEFTENGRPKEGWCTLDADLDNYARMTCLWREKDIETARPGLEAMFIRLGAI
jgi:hypothetical protein